MAQARVQPGGSACGAHGPNPSVKRTAKWRLGCLVRLALACAICRPLTSNVGPSTSCQSSSSNWSAFAGKAAGEEVGLAGPSSPWWVCMPRERTGVGGQRELKGKGCGGCVHRRLPGKSFMPKREWAARPLAGSEVARHACSCQANAQAAGRAEVVAVVRCRGSDGGWREVVGMGSSERPVRLVAVSVCAG